MSKTFGLLLLLALCGCATNRNDQYETDVWREYSQELGKVMQGRHEPQGERVMK